MTQTGQLVTEKPSSTEYATVAEACAMLNVSAVRVYQLIRMGELEAVRYGRRNYVSRASVEGRLENGPLFD